MSQKTQNISWPGFSFQVVDTTFFALEDRLSQAISSGDEAFTIKFLDEMIRALHDAKGRNQFETWFYRYKLYLDNLDFPREEPIMYSADYLEGSRQYRIDWFQYWKGHLKGDKPHFEAIVTMILELAFFYKGAQMFKEDWYISPDVEFSEQFIRELRKYAKDFDRHCEYSDVYRNTKVEGLAGLKPDEYHFVYRMSDADLKSILDGRFPHHSEAFEATFEPEIQVWDKMVAASKAGCWIIFW